jgi:hypothetical protein
MALLLTTTGVAGTEFLSTGNSNLAILCRGKWARIATVAAQSDSPVSLKTEM